MRDPKAVKTITVPAPRAPQEPQGNYAVVGVEAIAGVLKVPSDRVIYWIKNYSNFPVKRDGPKGAYISSRRKILDWLDWYLEQPD